MIVEYNGLSVTALPLGVFILGLILYVAWRGKYSHSYILCLFIFGIYILFALDKAYFPIRFSETTTSSVTMDQFMRSINLIPFKFDFSELPNIVLTQIVQNVLLTIPFGFGIRFVARVKAKDMFRIALTVGFWIEAGQLVISLILGYLYRIVDVNDLILNASGVLVGYAGFRVFIWLYLWAVQRFEITPRGFGAYLYDTASQG